MASYKKKLNRLQTKYTNILKKDYGIQMSETPTKVLALCNGGLCNGITYNMVLNIFQLQCNIEDILMVPGKSYSFIKFSDEKKAMKAYENLNGTVIWPEVKGPIYLGYVTDFNSSVLEGNKIFKKPPDLVLIEDFITNAEEQYILNVVGFSENDENSSDLKHRKVKHYGYEFKYSNNNVDLNDPIDRIPKELDFLWERLKLYSDRVSIDFTPDQLTINHYLPGQGIPPHVDTHSAFEDGIFSLSLQSSVVMEFKNENSAYNVVLPRKSLCAMFGESRYDWTHGISQRKSDLVPKSTGSLVVQNREVRTSLTFRKTRSGACACKYPRLCDTILEKVRAYEKIGTGMQNISLKRESASELELTYVHEVYEKIASHFSETRYKPWPNVQKFVNSLDTASILVDIGCGNGKYFSNPTNKFEVGCDSSNGLIKVCKEQGFECFSCNCLSIPLKDNIADACICIAVIHHLTTEERRKKAIQELIRILRSNGKALIYVWAKNQEMETKKSTYIKQYNKKEKKKDEEYELRLLSFNKSKEELVLPVHINRTNFDHNNLLVPWKLKTKACNSNENSSPVFLRFYHVYEDNELKNMCMQMNNVSIIDYYYDQGNWCILLEKK